MAGNCDLLYPDSFLSNRLAGWVPHLGFSPSFYQSHHSELFNNSHWVCLGHSRAPPLIPYVFDPVICGPEATCLRLAGGVIYNVTCILTPLLCRSCRLSQHCRIVNTIPTARHPWSIPLIRVLGLDNVSTEHHHGYRSRDRIFRHELTMITSVMVSH